MIDRPDEVRRIENFKRLQLTDFKIEIPKLAKKKALKEALESNGKASSKYPAIYSADRQSGVHQQPCNRTLSYKFANKHAFLQTRQHCFNSSSSAECATTPCCDTVAACFVEA